MSIPPVDGFDQYRTERKRRHLDSGPKRQAALNSSVLQELEAHEASTARNERMTREVQEFFEDATRTAASMVTKLSSSAEQEQDVSVAREMSEFLNETLRRARAFIEEMQSTGQVADGIEEFLPNLRNVVGPTLDAYRWEGSPGVAEAQIGRDPFAVDDGGVSMTEAASVDEFVEVDDEDDIVEVSVDGDFVPMDESHDHFEEEPVAPIEEHLVAEFMESAPQSQTVPAECQALSEWAFRIGSDDATLRRSLKALVHVGSMTKDEARGIYQELRTITSS